MIARPLLCILFVLLCVPLSRAEDPSDELIMARRQAQGERRKEEQIQMLRLELEKLKLEMEMRKTMSEMGLSSETSLSGSLPKVSMDVKNIVTTNNGIYAVVEVSGSRNSVKAGDTIGPYKVKRIEPSEVILSDENSIESRVSLRL